jgi:excisionase family DNA binding protein
MAYDILRRMTKYADKLLTTAEAAELLGISLEALRVRRSRYGEPPYVQLGPATIRYRRSDLDAWIEARVVTPTPAA